MEQKDYLMREIEKIGFMLRAIFNKLIGKKNDFSITMETKFDYAKTMMQNEIDFDLPYYLSLDKTESELYIHKFQGLNVANIELLADILQKIAMGSETISAEGKVFFEKSLNLYEHCNLADKTFSFAREQKINDIKRILS